MKSIFWLVFGDPSGLGIQQLNVSILRLITNIAITRLEDIAPSELDRAGARGSDYFLVYAAYPADRRYVLSAQFGCHLLAQGQGLWLTDCDARPASSGGPVFVQRNDGLKLAAIMVGTGPSGSVAIPIPNWVNLPAARKCP
jgi:hypothetical protein